MSLKWHGKIEDFCINKVQLLTFGDSCEVSIISAVTAWNKMRVYDNVTFVECGKSLTTGFYLTNL